MEDTTFEKIYAKVWKTGNSLVITIPLELCTFAGINNGENLRVWLKKIEVPEQ